MAERLDGVAAGVSPQRTLLQPQWTWTPRRPVAQLRLIGAGSECRGLAGPSTCCARAGARVRRSFVFGGGGAPSVTARPDPSGWLDLPLKVEIYTQEHSQIPLFSLSSPSFLPLFPLFSPSLPSLFFFSRFRFLGKGFTGTE